MEELVKKVTAPEHQGESQCIKVSEERGEARSSYKQRRRRNRRRTFKGSKERYREKNRELSKVVEQVQSEYKTLNDKHKVLVRKSLVLQRKCNLLTKSSTVHHHQCGTEVTSGLPKSASSDYQITSLRHVSRSEIAIDKVKFLGKGVFGKCFTAMVGHREVCAKVFRRELRYATTFPVEAALLAHCCHENLPWLYGICTDGPRKIIVMSLHTLCGSPVTIHNLLCNSCGTDCTIDTQSWQKILLGIANGTKYLHSINILHNDIKGDNVLVEQTALSIRSVITDLGKGCYLKNAKDYSLSQQEKEEFARRHPQIAPDLVMGHCKQSHFSDIYSVGRVIKDVNEKMLKMPALDKYSSLCMTYLCTARPNTNELCTFLSNLFCQ